MVLYGIYSFQVRNSELARRCQNLTYKVNFQYQESCNGYHEDASLCTASMYMSKYIAYFSKLQVLKHLNPYIATVLNTPLSLLDIGTQWTIHSLLSDKFGPTKKRFLVDYCVEDLLC